jgi:hypothetical protein
LRFGFSTFGVSTFFSATGFAGSALGVSVAASTAAGRSTNFGASPAAGCSVVLSRSWSQRQQADRSPPP